MIRTIIVVLFILIFFIISLPLFLILEIIGHFDIRRKERISFAIVTAVFRVIRFLSGTRLTVIGKEHVPADGPVLYVPNHRSYFDIVMMYPITRCVTGFVAKQELLKVPVLRRWMRYLKCEFLDRDDVRQAMNLIKDCAAAIKEGYSYCIFPEGTRNMGDELLEFKGGSLKIAQRGGCPIVPVAISGTDQVLEQHMPFIRAHKVVIEFGQPVFMDQLTRDEQKHLAETLRQNISEMLEKNKELTK